MFSFSLHENTTFPFSKYQKGGFVKEVQKIQIKNAPPKFSKIIDIILCRNQQLVECPKLLGCVLNLTEAPNDFAGSGEGLHYGT
jgi:hypothetical protein